MGHRALAVLLLVAAAASVPADTPTSAAPRPAFPTAGGVLSAERYARRMERAAFLARAAIRAPSSRSMARVRQTLGLPVTVSVGASTVRIPRDPVLDGLTGSTSDQFRRAARHLEVAAASVRAGLRAPPADPARIRAATERALRGLDTGRGLVERIRAAVGRFLLGVLDLLRHFRGAGSIVGWAIVVALVLAIVLLVRRAGLGLVPDRRARVAPAPVGPRRPEEWRLLAEDAAARGDARGAVRALYYAMVATLRARGLVPDLPSLTSGECRASVAAGAPALYPVVADASAVFERVTYGLIPAGRRDLERMRDADRSVEAA